MFRLLVVGFFYSIGVHAAIPHELILHTEHLKELKAESIYRYRSHHLSQSLLRLKGQLGSEKVDLEIDGSQLPVDKNSCPVMCAQLKDPQAQRCSGVCTYGSPDFLTASEESGIVFFYTANDVGKNVPLSVYAWRAKDRRPILIATAYGTALTNASYDSHKSALSFRADVQGASPEKLSVNYPKHELASSRQ